MNNKKSFSGTKKIGTFGVDAGLCWIGDPCYILHSKTKLSEDLGKDWGGFVDKFYEKDSDPLYKEFEDGVVVSTGYGDGSYPVYAEIKNGRVKSVTIKFIDENDSVEDEE